MAPFEGGGSLRKEADDLARSRHKAPAPSEIPGAHEGMTHAQVIPHISEGEYKAALDEVKARRAQSAPKPKRVRKTKQASAAVVTPEEEQREPLPIDPAQPAPQPNILSNDVIESVTAPAERGTHTPERKVLSPEQHTPMHDSADDEDRLPFKDVLAYAGAEAETLQKEIGKAREALFYRNTETDPTPLPELIRAYKEAYVPFLYAVLRGNQMGFKRDEATGRRGDDYRASVAHLYKKLVQDEQETLAAAGITQDQLSLRSVIREDSELSRLVLAASESPLGKGAPPVTPPERSSQRAAVPVSSSEPLTLPTYLTRTDPPPPTRAPRKTFGAMVRGALAALTAGLSHPSSTPEHLRNVQEARPTTERAPDLVHELALMLEHNSGTDERAVKQLFANADLIGTISESMAFENGWESATEKLAEKLGIKGMKLEPGEHFVFDGGLAIANEQGKRVQRITDGTFRRFDHLPGREQ